MWSHIEENDIVVQIGKKQVMSFVEQNKVLVDHIFGLENKFILLMFDSMNLIMISLESEFDIYFQRCTN